MLTATSRQQPGSARPSSSRPATLAGTTSQQLSRNASSSTTSPRSPGVRISAQRTSSGSLAAAAGSGDAGDEASSLLSPKPFLRRRSSAIVSSKVDWSQVTSRVNSRLEDHYILPAKAGKQRPASARSTGTGASIGRGAGAKTSRQGLRSAGGPRTGSGDGSQEFFMASDLVPPAKPKLHRSRSDSTIRQPHSTRASTSYSGAAYEVSRAPLPSSQSGGGSLGARSRQHSAGSQAASARQLSAGGTTANITDRRTSVTGGMPRTPKQPIRSDGGPTSPLDDLLQHVNSLIYEFDTKLMNKSNVH
jgi:hypothetical protein